jgi:histidine kinase
LNQPLSVIKTTSSFFIKKINQDEALQHDVLHTMLTKVDNNVDRATKIINHMRQFARKSDMEMEKVQINEVLGKAFEIFSQQLKVRGIEVSWNIEKNLPKIHADPDRLEQVFINLLLNARDAIEEKWYGQEPEDIEKKITLKSCLEGGKVIVEVCDTGIGIPDYVIDKIFDPFFTTKEVGKGTGLGLSISYSIINEFGGEITAAANADKGTCFRIKFPVAPATDSINNSKAPANE